MYYCGVTGVRRGNPSIIGLLMMMMERTDGDLRGKVQDGSVNDYDMI